jgi:hypothetical protein
MRCILLGILIMASCNSNKIDSRVLTLPTFNIQLLDSSHVVNTADIASGAPTIVLYFSPDCKFSRMQTETIVKNHEALKHVRFYMCSSLPLSKIKAFSDHYQLSKYDNITVGRDVNLFFEKDLKVPAFPWSFIYKADKKLKRILTGNADLKLLLEMTHS